MNNNLQLNSHWKKIYKISRIVLYAFFVFAFFYAAYSVLFPSAQFEFSFNNPDSAKNTIVEPRNESGTLNKNGKISASNKLIFDSNPLGDFSEAVVTFTLENKSPSFKNGLISTRRSYRAFFYPNGEPIQDIDESDLPQLLSAGNSVFISSRDKIWPIADAITFNSMGWNWNDVILSSSEEIGNYSKQKLFTLKNSHPDGTVFFDNASGKYFIIDNKTKRAIIEPSKILPKLKMNPVTADSKGLAIRESCQIKKSFSLLKKYSCTIPIEKMASIIGNDYQFETDFSENIEIRDLNITFKKKFNIDNLKSSISILKSRLNANYFGQKQ